MQHHGDALAGNRAAADATRGIAVAWDYTSLARSYLKRPDYAPEALDRLLSMAKIGAESRACDVGAGVGHLTRLLASRGLRVTAVEPNAAMRELGEQQLRQALNVRWAVGTGEATGQDSSTFDLVSFGSSFNVADRAKALIETHRILRPKGWFCCLWNHRDLDDPVQAEIERIITRHVPEYAYGTRREDQTAVIEASGLFGPVQFIEARITHRMDRDGVVEAWRSHATLQRQAKDRFQDVVDAVERYLVGAGLEHIDIPYVTRMWAAQRNAVDR